MYRDHQLAARCRKTHLAQHCPELPWILQYLYACRKARIWSSGVGLVGFGAMLVDILLGAEFLAQILVITWSMVAATSCAVWLISGEVLKRRTRRLFQPTGDALTDLLQIEHGGVTAYAIDRVHRLERASLVLPLVCLSLLTPLSIHLIVAMMLLGVSVEQFNQWILLSMVLVGHAHAALVVFSVRHVEAIRWALDTDTPVFGASRGGLALLWTVSISTVPGALLLFIPPIIVAMTGAVFIPWMFHWAARRGRFERMALQNVERAQIPIRRAAKP